MSIGRALGHSVELLVFIIIFRFLAVAILEQTRDGNLITRSSSCLSLSISFLRDGIRAQTVKVQARKASNRQASLILDPMAEASDRRVCSVQSQIWGDRRVSLHQAPHDSIRQPPFAVKFR
jgi:hypothetical protein